MSASRNPESMAQQGEFHSRRPRDEPLTTKGHDPAVHVGKDAYPEFHAQTAPPGSAPAESTFRPNNISETPGQALNPDAERSGARTTASSTIPGATSADVNKGMGHPGAGMTSSEAHGGKKKKERSGLEGVGASRVDPIRQQRADVGVEPGERGKTNTENAPSAEERRPISAEEVSTERDHEGRRGN